MAETILIIGATGVFGRRLSAQLAQTGGYALVLASRSRERAQRLVDLLAAQAETKAALGAIALDVAAAVGPAIAEARPRIVVDCSGPFQAMDYRVPLAAAAAGAHFVDLADARHYVLGFERALDAIFRSKGLVALAGASSSPALAAAAVRELTRDWSRIDHIDIAIAPGGRSEVGEAAVAAALSYCGRPVPIVAGGELGHAVGWGASRHVSMNGLGHRIVSAVETSDAELLRGLYPRATSIRLWAGLESTIEQRGMMSLARLHRAGLLRRPERLASLLTWARRLTRPATGDVGGMSVRVVGIDAQRRWSAAEWRLTARDNDGPQVPPSPAAAAARAILAGRIAPCARPATALALADIEAEFAGFAIRTERTSESCDRCLVETSIGTAQRDTLDQAVQAFHRIDAPAVWAGRAAIDGPSGGIAWIVARVVGFPAAGTDVPVTVEVQRSKPPGSGQSGLAETWTRTFGGRSFVSTLTAKGVGDATERFGPITFKLGLSAQGGQLHFPVTGWRLGPVPLPRALAPRSEAREWQDEQGRFNFDVRLNHALLGRLAHYRGWLIPASELTS